MEDVFTQAFKLDDIDRSKTKTKCTEHKIQRLTFSFIAIPSCYHKMLLNVVIHSSVS